jgi:hypothetical protein
MADVSAHVPLQLREYEGREIGCEGRIWKQSLEDYCDYRGGYVPSGHYCETDQPVGHASIISE